MSSELDTLSTSGREIFWIGRNRQSESTFSNGVFEKSLCHSGNLPGICNYCQTVQEIPRYRGDLLNRRILPIVLIMSILEMAESVFAVMHVRIQEAVMRSKRNYIGFCRASYRWSGRFFHENAGTGSSRFETCGILPFASCHHSMFLSLRLKGIPTKSQKRHSAISCEPIMD